MAVNAVATLAVLTLVATLSGGSASAITGPQFGDETAATGHPTRMTWLPLTTAPEVPIATLTAAEIASLPEARYDAVIAGLIGYSAASVPASMTMAYTVTVDTPIYGAGRETPVARLAALNFLGEKSVVVPVAFFDGWALVLTPARRVLPSTTAGLAAPQTAGWIRVDALVVGHLLTSRIVVSVRDQTLRIIDSTGVETGLFSIGVGTAATPTPTGVTGYIQARYLDAAQGQSTYPINLTTLHSAAADEPYGGSDGGLIGVHYFATSSGAVSHGCLRLPEDAIATINTLPIGTPITITY